MGLRIGESGGQTEPRPKEAVKQPSAAPTTRNFTERSLTLAARRRTAKAAGTRHHAVEVSYTARVPSIQINAVTRVERLEATARAREAIAAAGGAILTFEQFSNVSACVGLEIATACLPDLGRLLTAAGLNLSKRSELALASGSHGQTVPVTLQITFVHNEPDLRRHIPAIPG